jgi:hypothetical protein
MWGQTNDLFKEPNIGAKSSLIAKK